MISSSNYHLLKLDARLIYVSTDVGLRRSGFSAQDASIDVQQRRRIHIIPNSGVHKAHPTAFYFLKIRHFTGRSMS